MQPMLMSQDVARQLRYLIIKDNQNHVSTRTKNCLFQMVKLRKSSVLVRYIYLAIP
jgi:hypothetical protein